VIDRRWRDHLYEMDYLKDGIGLRAMAQRDPLVEYQREGFAMYQTMMGQIREETIGFLFNLEVEVTPGGTTAAAPIVAAKGLTGNTTPATKLSYSAPAEAGGVEVRNQRGQLDQASTAKAQKAADAVSPAFRPQPGAKTAQAEQPAARGAFGQNTGGGAAPVNRAERRAQEKRAKK
jgi:preprotein translocase subunit SecA